MPGMWLITITMGHSLGLAETCGNVGDDEDHGESWKRESRVSAKVDVAIRIVASSDESRQKRAMYRTPVRDKREPMSLLVSFVEVEGD